MEEQIAVVDEHNRFVRWENRSTIHAQRLVHRSVYVLVIDTAGRLLVQLRHRDKQTYPLHWDISCAGHICAEDYLAGPDDALDEVYRQTAARELEEELGIRAPLTHLGSFGPTPGIHYEQVRVFRASSDGPVTLQASELEEVRWLDRETFSRLLQDPEAKLTHALRYMGEWARSEGHW